MGVNFKISKKETYLLSVPSANRNAARKIVGITVNVIYMLVPMHFALNSLYTPIVSETIQATKLGN